MPSAALYGGSFLRISRCAGRDNSAAAQRRGHCRRAVLTAFSPRCSPSWVNLNEEQAEALTVLVRSSQWAGRPKTVGPLALTIPHGLHCAWFTVGDRRLGPAGRLDMTDGVSAAADAHGRAAEQPNCGRGVTAPGAVYSGTPTWATVRSPFGAVFGASTASSRAQASSLLDPQGPIRQSALLQQRAGHPRCQVRTTWFRDSPTLLPAKGYMT